jgi:serine/threonine protein kinase
MPISLDEFVRSLSDTGILPASEVTSIVTSMSQVGARVDAENLAKELVRQEKLTRFQAAVICKRQARGLRFGDYIVLDKIGSGGMGQVFKAENRRTGEIVALKLLRATYSKSPRAVARFYREAGAAARLSHPNLVSVSDAGEWNGLHFLVMELINGRDVRSNIKENGPISPTDAMDIVLQAARGLEHAHKEGIIHRDVKPANLLRDKSGRVVVLDLGLARLDEAILEEEGDDSGRLTQAGHFLGTLDFVSPEQTADAHEVDARSDIYSLGCTLYYLLRGQPPYRRETAAMILFAHCSDPIPNLQQEVPGVSERLNALFQRMLAKRTSERIGSMTEVIAELEACLEESKGGRKGSSASMPMAKPRSGSSAEFKQIPPVGIPLPDKRSAARPAAAHNAEPAVAVKEPKPPAARPQKQAAGWREETSNSADRTLADAGRKPGPGAKFWLLTGAAVATLFAGLIWLLLSGLLG